MKDWQPTPIRGAIPVGGRLFICRASQSLSDVHDEDLGQGVLVVKQSGGPARPPSPILDVRRLGVKLS